jgi:hypothetical protein
MNRSDSGVRIRLIAAAVIAGMVLTPPLLVLAGWAPPAVGALSAFGLALGAVMVLRRHAPALLLVCLTAALVATVLEQPWLNLSPSDVESDNGAALAQQWRRRGSFDESLPVVLHIVLDEMMSPGAIDPTLPGGEATRDAIYAFGERHGFRIFDSVYSRYFWSEGAMAAVLNADRLAMRHSDTVATLAAGTTNNQHFSAMTARGYRTVVFQSANLDFCESPDVAMCETFRSFDPASARETLLDDRTRTVHLWDAFLRAYEPSYLSAAGRWALRRFYGLDQRDLAVLGVADRFDVQGFGPWFERYKAFVTHVPRGTHVFAHFLAPHGPYLLSESCMVGGAYDVGYFLNGRFPNPAEREAARRTYFESYFDQVRCVVSKLDGLMQAIEGAPALADAVVIIHGDHGSRISSGHEIDDLSARDFVDNYAAFFATKQRQATPGIDCTFLSLPEAFRQAVAGEGATPQGAAPLPVLVGSRSGEGVIVEAPMPLFGCAAH